MKYWLLLWVCLAPVALADEFVVQARVVQAEPQFEVTMQRGIAAHCEVGKPHGRNLISVLAWDLKQDHCVEMTEEKRLTGYRIKYEWNGGVRTMMMAADPGESVPIRVSVR